MEGQTERTILYVDDQASHRLLFERTFRGDWLILTASSAEEGMKILQEHDIFLVVADHNMPGITGIDFLAEVEKKSPRIIRAILSAYADAQLKTEADRRAHVSAYLEKPWDRRRLEAFLEIAYALYNGAIQIVGNKERTLEQILQEGGISNERLLELNTLAGDKVDPRGARRIALTFSEPRIKETVALVRRPVDETLARAAAAAVKGKMEAVEDALLKFLKSRGRALPDSNLH